MGEAEGSSEGMPPGENTLEAQQHHKGTVVAGGPKPVADMHRNLDSCNYLEADILAEALDIHWIAQSRAHTEHKFAAGNDFAVGKRCKAGMGLE